MAGRLYLVFLKKKKKKKKKKTELSVITEEEIMPISLQSFKET